MEINRKEIVRIMIVDDDPINNTICKHLINRLLPELDVKSFTEPAKALEFISVEYHEDSSIPTVLLLDINMPEISGWDFLELFKDFSPFVHKQFTINILSSSVDIRDKDRATAIPFISNFLSKPLGPGDLASIFPGADTSK